VGGLVAGVVADAVDYGAAIAVVAALTALSGLWVAYDLPGGARAGRVAIGQQHRQTA
jgi:hypothetical protein